MIRRLFWFVLGLVTGVYAALWARRTAEEVAEKLTPGALADQFVQVLKAVANAAVSGAGFLLNAVTERASSSTDADTNR